ncbi:MAG: hypothetical protein IPG56_02865 [Caulobacteraceae bacterium]|nr:hypothetical protein [Caulobacteraceae bacterium]
MKLIIAAVAALLSASSFAFAQTPETVPPTEPAAAPAPAAQTIRIPAGTVVQLEITEALSSRSSQQQQLFGLRLAEPIIVDGRELAQGVGVDRTVRLGGRQGRLIISGRFIEINAQRARIRGMQITRAGEDRGNTALAVSMIPYAGVAGIFIQGGEVDIPIGARGTARLAEDFEFPIATTAGPALTAEPIATTTSEQPAQ